MNRLSLLFALSLSCSACLACATFAPDPVRTVGESALIVWNSKTRTEQFVRRATFQTKAKNFGFVVPTPSRPQLSAADDALFDSLEQELEPKTVTKVRRGVDFAPLVAFASFSSSGSAKRSNAQSESAANAAAGSTNAVKSVEVVEQKRVGSYNAVVLRASDSKTFVGWLKKHRYPVSSDTREWLAPYVKRGFFLSVFQIASGKESQSAQAQAVRLSFKSEAPFFPYRELKRAQKVGGGRTLLVFFVGQTRVEANIENEGKRGVWPAAMTYSAPLDARKLKGQLDLPPGNLRLTAFEDESSPRPGWGDLRFSRSKVQSELSPPPNILWKDERRWIPADVLALGAALLVWMGFAWRRRQTPSSSEAQASQHL